MCNLKSTSHGLRKVRTLLPGAIRLFATLLVFSGTTVWATKATTVQEEQNVQDVKIVHPEPKEPMTYARYISEKRGDFAWENDRVAFRTYGPLIKDEKLTSGIDCWMKRVDYPIINKWYREAFAKISSYHQDIGEGGDQYETGASLGCGGTALWMNNDRVMMGKFVGSEIIEQTKERTQFLLQYKKEIDGCIYEETKHFTIELGNPYFELTCTYKKDGKPAVGLPICIGVSTQELKGEPIFNREKGWIGCSFMAGKGAQKYWMGTFAMIDDPQQINSIKVSEEVDEIGDSHIFILCKTDENASVSYRAGYAWERWGDIKNKEQLAAYLNQLN